ncbi:MAG TPA: hypothetical protein IGS40_23975 [Trichormus sp. M33_DOE_039]|nr:hypothetical protein [Trichormus sp. M33_DOE_039]
MIGESVQSWGGSLLGDFADLKELPWLPPCSLCPWRGATDVSDAGALPVGTASRREG